MARRTLVVLAALLLAIPTSAQGVRGWDEDPYGGTLTLSSGFSDDPRTLDVRPGGNNANPISGPGCAGYIGSRPDVVVEYEAGTWDLTFSAASETDVTLVVRDPYGGYHCDDDSGAGSNPALTIEDPASGRYTVWVGVYGAAGEYVDGVFGVSEVGSEVGGHDGRGSDSSDETTFENPFLGDGGRDRRGSSSGSARASGEIDGWDGTPYYGTAVLDAGFSGDPRTVAVNAGGSQANPLAGPGCVGYIGRWPDHVVAYTAGTHDLTFSAASDVDLTLVVRTPSGTYLCDDDSGAGSNPRIEVVSPESGRYRVWVGTYSQDYMGTSSTLAVSELGLEAQ